MKYTNESSVIESDSKRMKQISMELKSKNPDVVSIAERLASISSNISQAQSSLIIKLFNKQP